MPTSSQVRARNAASSGCTNGPTFANATPNFMGDPPSERTGYTHASHRPQRGQMGIEEPPARIEVIAHAPPVAPVRVERRELGSAAVVDLAPVRPPVVRCE